MPRRLVIEIHTNDERLWLAWQKLTATLARAGWQPDEVLIKLLEIAAKETPRAK